MMMLDVTGLAVLVVVVITGVGVDVLTSTVFVIVGGDAAAVLLVLSCLS